MQTESTVLDLIAQQRAAIGDALHIVLRLTDAMLGPVALPAEELRKEITDLRTHLAVNTADIGRLHDLVLNLINVMGERPQPTEPVNDARAAVVPIRR